MNRTTPIYGLLTLNAITIFGNALTEIAIPWLILEISNSPAIVAIVMSAKVLPIIVSTFTSAYIVDRFGSFRMSVLSDTVNCIAVLLIPLFYAVDMLSFALLAVLVMVSTILDSPSRLAKDVMLAKALASGNYNNARINSLNSSLETLSDMLAPMLAALIIPVAGTIGALYFDAVTFFVVAVGIVYLRKYLDYSESESMAISKPWAFFVEGLAYLKQDASLLGILIVSSVVNTVITPLLTLYLPVVAKNTFGNVLSLGMLMSCFVCGTVVSQILYAIIGSRFSNKRIIIIGYSILSIVILSISFFTWYYAIFIQLFFVGLSIGFSAPIEITYIQQNVPEQLFSRTVTLFTSIRFLCVPLGYACFGILLESSFVILTPIVMAVFVAFGVLCFAALTAKHSYNNPN